MMSACPWSGYEPTQLIFCEAPRCAWVEQPANAVSSLAYIVVGVIVLRQHRLNRRMNPERPPASPKPVLRWFGIMAILIGSGSFLFHSSLTFFGEWIDIGSMFLFSCLLLTLNLERIGWITSSRFSRVYLPTVIVSLALFLVFHTIGIYLFAIQAITVIALELVLMKTNRVRHAAGTQPLTDYRQFLAAITLFAVSYGVWLLDFHRIVCDPENHWLQGHAVWHLLNSLCFLQLHRFYSQFEIRG